MSQMPPPAPGGGPGWGPGPGAGPGYPPPADPGYPPPPGYPPSADPGYPPQPSYPPQPGFGPPPGPGYGPQPGYGAPGGPPPGRKRSPLLPIVIVLALVAAGVGGYFLLAGGEGGDPESVARQYFEAMMDGDCEAAVDLVALGDTSSEDALAECRDMVAASGLGSGDVSDEIAQFVPTELVSARVTEEGDSSATVAVEYRMGDGSTTTNDLALVKVDGDWKVDIDAVLGAPTADDPVDEPTDEPVDLPVDEPVDEPVGGGSEPPLDDPEAQADPALADLAVACSEGDMVSCDDLYWGTDAGGVLEAYAETCGGRAPGGGVSGGCAEQYG
jgi:Domain of unknown function (DUF4878)